MIIQNNILKEYLKNVYFVCGNACAGKTTTARLLAEKYGYLLYDMDKHYEMHRAIATPDKQPNMCYHCTNFDEQYTRPIEEQVNWNINSLTEQTEMVLMDLIRLSQNQIVIADVLFSPIYTKDIIANNHIVFLTVDKSVIRPTYFNRPEKVGFYKFVKKQEKADVYFENIFTNLEATNELEQKLMKKSGFKMIERTNQTQDEMVELVANHFNLGTVSIKQQN